MTIVQELNPISVNPTKWSKTLKQFFGKLPTNCLNVFDHFAKLALKGLNLDSLVTLILYIWMPTRTSELLTRRCLSLLVFKKFSENQLNILCVIFSSFCKIGITSGRQVYGVVSSAKLSYSKSTTSKKRSNI